MRTVIWTLFTLMIAGCTTYGSAFYHESLGTYDPSPANGFKGLIAYEPGADYEGYMRMRCRSYGGLNPNSVEDGVAPKAVGNNLGFVKQYRCYGPPQKTDTWVKTPESDSSTVNIRNVGDSKASAIDETTLHGGTKQTPAAETVTMDAAKAECEVLGFKPKTEAFGNCVLKLTE